MCFSKEMDAKSAARLAPRAEEAAWRLDLIFRATFRYVRPGPKSKGAAEAYCYTAR